MSGTDKAKNAAEKVKGRAKQTAGAATGNREKEREGRLDEKQADVKQAGEKLKDVADQD